MAIDSPPRWDVSDVFPDLASRSYAASREGLSADIHRLAALYDEHDVRAGEARTVDDATVAAFDAVLDATNAVLDRVRLLYAYVSSYVTTDARSDLAQGELSGLQAELAELAKLRGRLDAWVASLGDEALAARSQVAADHAYPLRRAALRATHQMSEAEEALHADLSLTGSTAWQRLYGTLTSQLSVPVPGSDGTAEVLPMSQVRGRAHDADPARRRAAYEAELEAWEAGAVPIIAALNAIKGEAATVNRRRGFVDDLEPALLANGVDRPTLDAMQSACVEAFPAFRRYLRAKAGALGHDGGLPWHDLFAPVGGTPARTWEEATGAVTSSFGSYSPGLAGLARRAVGERWIDAEPRDGKRDGAFCMGLDGDRSLVLMNFDGSARDVQTLAHELGHAYHNVTLAHRTPLQRQLPMALAETASIFCETILVQDSLAAADGDQRLALLEADLQASCQVVVDIHSRFLFEQAFCRARATRTVSADEACALMADAQEATYGDGLHPDLRHPWMWAAKPHYYSSAFYNWPYTFGLLFGLGLYARYTEDPERFRAGYDDLLSSVGLAGAADLAARFDIDVRDGAFWAASLEVVRGRIDELVGLLATSPRPTSDGARSGASR